MNKERSATCEIVTAARGRYIESGSYDAKMCGKELNGDMELFDVLSIADER